MSAENVPTMSVPNTTASEDSRNAWNDRLTFRLWLFFFGISIVYTVMQNLLFRFLEDRTPL